jgi:methionyl-tRNA formyltransferase
MKCIFFGTPEFASAILEKLVQAGIQFAAVVTRPDTPQGRLRKLTAPAVKQTALKILPDVPILQPVKCSSPESIQELKRVHADLFIVAAYGEILSQAVLDIPPKGCINVHASLLPAFRGAAPMQRALMQGCKETGVSIMRMVRKMDAGNLLDVEKMPIPEDMTIVELEHSLRELGVKALLRVIPLLETGSLEETPQDESKATFAPKITPQDSYISWQMAAREIHNQIRALTPFPGAFAEVVIRGEKKRLKIIKAQVFSDEHESNTPTLAGSFFQDAKDTLFVACGRGILQILEVQLEGKKSLPVSEFLKGVKASDISVLQRTSRATGKTSSCFRPESIGSLEQVRRPIYERLPIAYDDDWVASYKPNQTFYIPLESRMQLEKAGMRAKQEEPAGTYAHQIFTRLLVDLSYNSSRLEGNTYSLLETQKLLLEGTGAEGKMDEEKVMILNHKEAIRYLVDNAFRIEVSKQVICTLHYLLSDGLIEAHYAGKIRDREVRIGGSTYLPFKDKKQLQTRFTNIIEKAVSIENPFEQSLFLLVHITYLQAFIDVNKRTARLSANIPLIKKNLVPLSFNDIDREEYISSIIAVYELCDINPLLDLYIFSYMRTCAMYDSTVKALGYDEVRVRYRKERRGIIREVILKKISGKALKEYIHQQTLQLVPEADQELFLGDVLEDLQEIDLSRIAGLGITEDELQEWLGRGGDIFPVV